MEPSPAFEAAMAVLGQDPLPADAAKQLAALEGEVRPDERERFGDLWEAYYAAGGE